MKFFHSIVLAIAIPAMGCREQPKPVVVVPATPPSAAPAVVIRDVDPTTREVYVAGMREKLKEFDGQMAAWNATLSRTNGPPRVAMQTKMGELKLKRDQFEREIAKLAESAGARWIHEKNSADRAYVELRSAFERSADAFR